MAILILEISDHSGIVMHKAVDYPFLPRAGDKVLLDWAHGIYPSIRSVTHYPEGVTHHPFRASAVVGLDTLTDEHFKVMRRKKGWTKQPFFYAL